MVCDDFSRPPTEGQIEAWARARVQVGRLLGDLAPRATKAPGDLVSETALALARAALADARVCLCRYPDVRFIHALPEPGAEAARNPVTLGDLALILGQAEAALKAFHAAFYCYDEEELIHYWKLRIPD
ncbi:MAG TPA: hypothetical protein VIL84_00765 [Devosiaceae bacterium]